MGSFLHTVTISGVDALVDPADILYLSGRYPYVEWGVLLSRERVGPRYPHEGCVEALLGLGDWDGVRLAGHLCGEWARDVADGGWMFWEERPRWKGRFPRIQLNLGGRAASLEGPRPRSGACLSCGSHPMWCRHRLVVQVGEGDAVPDWLLGDYWSPYDVLFDRSGGRGQLPGEWPSPPERLRRRSPGMWPVRIGYAGGLTPENLAEQLPLIEVAANGHGAWIDVESGVRTPDDKIDMEKVEAFLRVAEPYVCTA